jgi:hypothetical protein
VNLLILRKQSIVYVSLVVLQSVLKKFSLLLQENIHFTELVTVVVENRPRVGSLLFKERQLQHFAPLRDLLDLNLKFEVHLSVLDG